VLDRRGRFALAAAAIIVGDRKSAAQQRTEPGTDRDRAAYCSS
jgi:hypothetical protein